MEIYPSLISSDVLHLAQTLALLDQHCDGYHLDVMDDHFVPNLTWGPAFINAIAKNTALPLNVHLMVDNPEQWITRLNLTPKDCFIFHWEAVNDNARAQQISETLHAAQINVGIALNPSTAVNALEKILPYFNHVLLMSVEPGFSGQGFIDVTHKVSELKQMKAAQGLDFVIGMDGGINQKNIKSIAELGVDYVGVASALFHQPDSVAAIKNLYNLIS